MKRIRELNRKVVIVIILCVVLAVGLGVGGWYVHAENVKAENIEQVEQVNKKHMTNLNTLESEIDKLYFDKNAGYLNADISSDKIDDLVSEVEAITLSDIAVNQKDLTITNTAITETKEELKQELTNLITSFDIQTSVNNLFESTVISEDQMNSEIAVKTEITSDEITVIIDKLVAENDWQKLMKSALDNASEQISTRDNAKALITALFDEKDTVKADVSRESYTQAQEALASLKDGSVKNELSTKLESILKLVEEKEAQTQRQSEANQPSGGGQSNNGGGNTYTPPTNNGSGNTSTPPTNNSGGNTSTPPAPSSGSTTSDEDVKYGNSSGIEDSPGGWDTPNNAGMIDDGGLTW